MTHTKTLPKILIGADPEIFVSKVNKTANGMIVSEAPFSAHGLVSGTKASPLKVNKGAVQVDGTALEFNIEPAATATEFRTNIQTVMQTLETMMKLKDDTLDFNISPAVVYPQNIFVGIPEEALELGCEPDYNAYTKTANPRPDASALRGLETLRTASGHVHIGWTEGADKSDPAHFEDCCILAKYLDATLGHASKGWDGDSTRSRLYGAPGAFRPKPYGMEYRTLSNVWLKDPDLIDFVFNTTKKITQALLIYGKGTLARLYNEPGMMLSNNLRRDLYNYYWGNIMPNVPDRYADRRSYSPRYSNAMVFPDAGRALEEAFANA